MMRVLAFAAALFALAVSPASAGKLVIAKPTPTGYSFSLIDLDREAVKVVKQFLIDLGQAETIPPDDRLFTEKFLP